MTDTTNTTTTDATVETNGEATTPCVLYATRAECEAAKPNDAPKSLKVFTASKDGKVIGHLWGRGYADTLASIARKDGYSVSLSNSKPVTKEAVIAKLAEFTDAELAAMGLSRKTQRGAKK